VVREGLPGEDAELPQQLHLPRFEVSLLVPATDTERPALLGAAQHRNERDRAQARRVQAAADQIRIDARADPAD
jgi:hypothetical protein